MSNSTNTPRLAADTSQLGIHSPGDMLLKSPAGFTLIEIIIALAIFAIMSVIITSALYTVFQTRHRVNEHADRLAQLQFAFIIMQRDIEQAITRNITDESHFIQGALNGDTLRLEFTRAGHINPLFKEQRSSLQRVAYVFDNNILYRQSWQSLDRTTGTKSERRALLNNVSKISFGYFNPENRLQNNWFSVRDAGFPKAIQVNLQLNDWGNLSLLFAISSGVKQKLRATV